MGILNITPDSFSDGGRYISEESVRTHVQRMLDQGMDIVDIGAESTRPGSTAITAEEEWSRLEPVLGWVRSGWPNLTISVDTSKAEVASRALKAGAHWINDVWGGRRGDFFPEKEQPAMGQVVAKAGCPVVFMHNRPSAEYVDFWSEFDADIDRILSLAHASGVRDEQIWLDPGFGFGKKVVHNLEILKHLDRLVARGYPVLLGTSRKSTIGHVLGREVDQRGWGTAATVCWGVSKGCKMVRVHDVCEMSDVVRMTEAIQAGIGFGTI
jgi:dihydropteroate synthase